MASCDHFMGQLRTLRARLMLQRFCNVWARAALAVGGVLVIAVALQRAMNRGTTFPMFWAGLAVLTTTVGAAAIAFTRRHSWNDVASVVDRRASTRDRFATALSFAKEPRPENENAPLKTLAAAECQEFLANRRFIEFFPWRVPREAGWLLVPVVMLALLQWDAHVTQARLAALHSEAQREVGATADTLEKLAKATASTSDARGDLARISEQLRRSAEELRATADSREAARKAALRELSALEKTVRAARENAEDVSPEEWKEIAKALAQNDATKNAADALAAGNLADAARELAKAAEADETTIEQAQKALDAALQRLAEKRELNKALDALAKEMRSSTASRALLQRLAEMMANAQRGGQSASGGPSSSKQTLQNLLAMLQSLKFGENGNPASVSKGPPGKPLDGQVSMQSFGGDRSQEPPAQGEASLPSGLPGSERDLGSTPTVLGEPEKPQGEKGADLSATARLGPGETFSALVPTAVDGSKANVRYKAIYDAMAPAAENAVLQENIPLGSRFFIKRYFEAIRPLE